MRWQALGLRLPLILAATMVTFFLLAGDGFAQQNNNNNRNNRNITEYKQEYGKEFGVAGSAF